MEFMSGPTGPVRDHKVVRESGVVAKLNAVAVKSMARRSREQAFTNHQQNTGYAAKGPVGFGTFECGRSSMPGNVKPTAAFMDSTTRGHIHPHMDGVTQVSVGDPGAYNPYTAHDMAARASFSHNRTNKPFGATAERLLNLELHGEGVPAPGTYKAADAAKKTHLAVNHNRSVFMSGSSQRPHHATPVPSPDAYRPNTASIYNNIRDSGASMRGSLARLAVMAHPDHTGGDQSQTDITVGPGTYNEHMHNTVAVELARQLSRSSKIRTGFGSNTAQRDLPYGQSDDSPGPGAYQPDLWAGPYAAPWRTQAALRRSQSAPRLRPTVASTPTPTPPVQQRTTAAPS